MALIVLETRIAAPPERVFDLSRSVELHLRSTARTGEQASRRSRDVHPDYSNSTTR